MYLAGYVIECKLKARLMEIYGVWKLADLEKRLGLVETRETNKLFNHKIEVLFEFLKSKVPSFPFSEPRFHRAYILCKTWRSNWRYDASDGNETDCADFLEAIDTVGKFIDNNL